MLNLIVFLSTIDYIYNHVGHSNVVGSFGALISSFVNQLQLYYDKDIAYYFTMTNWCV